MDRLEQAAQFMLDQHNAKLNFQNLPEALMPSDFDEAYKAPVSYTHLTLPTNVAV